MSQCLLIFPLLLHCDAHPYSFKSFKRAETEHEIWSHPAPVSKLINAKSLCGNDSAPTICSMARGGLACVKVIKEGLLQPLYWHVTLQKWYHGGLSDFIPPSISLLLSCLIVPSCSLILSYTSSCYLSSSFLSTSFSSSTSLSDRCNISEYLLPTSCTSLFLPL